MTAPDIPVDCAPLGKTVAEIERWSKESSPLVTSQSEAVVTLTILALCAALREAYEDAEGVRESLDQCLAAMREHDPTDYDDYDGPHLSTGIQKLGQQLREAREENARLQVVADQARILRAEYFIEHQAGCDTGIAPVRPCTCGLHGLRQRLYDALDALRASTEEPRRE